MDNYSKSNIDLTSEEDILKQINNKNPQELASMVYDQDMALKLIERLPLEEKSVLILKALGKKFNNKKITKAIKRIIFKLKNKDIKVDEIFIENDQTQGILKPPEKNKPIVYIGPIKDLTGFRTIMMVINRFGFNNEVVVSLLSDEFGVKEFLVGVLSKKRIKEMKNNLSQEAGPLIKTSIEHAVTIIEKAYQRHLELNIEIPSPLVELRPWLTDNISFLEKPIVYDFIDSSIIEEGTLGVSQLEKLFEHDLLASWFIDYEELLPIIDEIINIDKTGITLTRAQKMERANQIKEKSVEKIFPQSKRDIIKHRFEEMAYMFYQLEENYSARLSLAAARTMDEKDGTIKLNPVVEFLLERSLKLVTSLMNEEKSSAKNLEESSSGRIII